MTSVPGRIRMHDWLARRAAHLPDRPALISEAGTLSFAELDRRVSTRAAALERRGVGPGDRVALLGANSVEYVCMVHAIGRRGAVLVPLNTRLAPAEAAARLEEARVRLLAHDAENAEAATAAAAATRAVGLPENLECIPFSALFAEEGPDAASAGRRPSLSLSDLHSIVYTSGTTAAPKGVRLTWGNHWWSAVGSAVHLGTRADDVWLACMPLFHVGGLAILLRSLLYGITVALHDRFDPDRVDRALREGSVTLLSVVEVMLERILEVHGNSPYPDTLRCVLVGGGPVSADLLARGRALGLPLCPTYGLTEAASQVATGRPPAASRAGAGGSATAAPPFFMTRIRIAEPDPGGIGEITLRGPNISEGYHERPEETRRAWREGWFHTGDVGRLDESGDLSVLDRRADLFVSGGENVSPAEIEAVLAGHPDISESGVASLEDADWGRVPVAFLVLRPGRSMPPESELTSWCRRRLAGYKVPTGWRDVEELPRTASGKLSRADLQKMADGSSIGRTAAGRAASPDPEQGAGR